MRRTPPGLDRNELGALLIAAGLGPPAEHALISLLALNGLRVSEATGADIEALGLERGHRTGTPPTLSPPTSQEPPARQLQAFRPAAIVPAGRKLASRNMIRKEPANRPSARPDVRW
jgi:integrase